MRKMLGAFLLASVFATAAAPAALGDSAAWRVRAMECGAVGADPATNVIMSFVLPPAEFNTAFVPVHSATGTAVLTPLVVRVDGETYVSKPLANKAGNRLVECGYVDPMGLTIDIVGILTPAS